MRPELESQHRETTNTFMLLRRAPADMFWSRQVQKLSRGQSRPAEILSAGIKPLPALAALSKKKKKEKSARNKTKTNQPKKQLLSVTFSLALLFLACVCVCVRSTFQGLLAVSPGHWCRDFSPSPASQAQALPQTGLCSRALAIICLICQKRRDVPFAQSLFNWRSL